MKEGVRWVKGDGAWNVLCTVDGSAPFLFVGKGRVNLEFNVDVDAVVALTGVKKRNVRKSTTFSFF